MKVCASFSATIAKPQNVVCNVHTTYVKTILLKTKIMAIYWYQCKKCTTLIKQDSTPKNSGCPKASFHDWKKLGELGDKNYLCKKCGTSIQTKSTPANSGCPEASFHDWKKL